MESCKYVVCFRLYYIIFNCNPLYLLTLWQISFKKNAYGKKSCNGNFRGSYKSFGYVFQDITAEFYNQFFNDCFDHTSFIQLQYILAFYLCIIVCYDNTVFRCTECNYCFSIS